MKIKRRLAIIAITVFMVFLIALSVPTTDAKISASGEGTVDIVITIPKDPNPPLPFDWNWPYAGPTCEGIEIQYPANLPSSQSGVMEVNVLAGSVSGMMYKLEGDAYQKRYPNGHAGVTIFIPWSEFRNYKIPESGQWTVDRMRVHGTNFQWQGNLVCGQ